MSSQNLSGREPVSARFNDQRVINLHEYLDVGSESKRRERKDVGLVSHGWLREEVGPIKILWRTVLVCQEKDLKGG